MTNHWCILQTRSDMTLAVFHSLRSAGLDVWAPIERRHVRKPRSKSRYYRERAISEGYLFGHASHMDAFRQIVALPTSDHPRFWLLTDRDTGAYPLLADEQLEGFRAEERVRSRRFDKQRKPPTYEPGAEVKAPDGYGFEGMTGTVVKSSGQWTWINFPGYAQPIKISSLLIPCDVVNGNGAFSGSSAVAA